MKKTFAVFTNYGNWDEYVLGFVNAIQVDEGVRGEDLIRHVIGAVHFDVFQAEHINGVEVTQTCGVPALLNELEMAVYSSLPIETLAVVHIDHQLDMVVGLVELKLQ